MTARAHIAQQRYRDALAEWNAAYEIRQHPDLLLELARTQQRLGMTQESVASYRRFLTAHESASPEFQARSDASHCPPVCSASASTRAADDRAK
jgi:tetratricopeptide (TPR) repeat protein